MIAVLLAVVFAAAATAAWHAVPISVARRDGAEPAADPLASPRVPAAISLGCAAGGAVIALAITGIPALGAIAATFAWSAPGRLVAVRHRRALDTADRQLIELVRGLAAGTRAGLNLHVAAERAAAMTPPPLGVHAMRLAHELRHGRTLEGGFRALADRLGSTAADRLAAAVAVGAGIGGPIRETLDHLERQLVARTAADRKRIERTRSARRQAMLVSSFIPIMLIVFLAAMGEQVGTFYRSAVGTAVLVVVAVVMRLSQRWIDAIARAGART